MEWKAIGTLNNPFLVVWLKTQDGRILKGSLNENPDAVAWAKPVKI